MLKNPKGKQNLAAFEALDLAGCQPRFGLSGTPMSNKYEELWSLFDFVSNKQVGTRLDFIKYYTKSLGAGFKLNASQYEINTRMRRQKQIKELTDKWMLQRFKTLIQDQMPNKEDNIVFCKLASEQQARLGARPPSHLAPRLGARALVSTSHRSAAGRLSPSQPPPPRHP